MTSHANPKRPLVIYGAGGHGLVVAEAATAAGYIVLGFMDDSRSGEDMGAWRLLDDRAFQHTDAGVLVAIGDNFARRRLMQDMIEAERPLVSVQHPTASVSPSARIGPGVFIGPQAVVNAGARIGDGAIINSGAIVEHDCQIEAYAHIAPGSALGGGVCVGQMSTVGLGARVLPRVRIGEAAMIGAGAVVVEEVPDHVTVVGVPARVRQSVG